MNLPTTNQQIIFVDPSVQNYQSLIQNIDAAQIFILNENLSGIEQITNALANQKDIEAVHILSHGSEGSLKLGSDVLNGNDIENFNTQLKQWGNGLTENGDILLYGCDAAAGETGNNFVKRLSELTGADVAASNDLTGNAVKGGDWDLEIVTGQIESAVPFNRQAMEDYDYTLANFDVTVATDDGTGTVAGTLSKAILDANAAGGDDTITIQTNVRFTGTPNVPINSNIAFIGGGFIVSGDINNNSINDAGDVRPFFVNSGIVSFSNMTITNGRAQGGNGGRSSGSGGGAAAGMGGGLFVYNGTVALNNIAFNGNQAIGGGGGGYISGFDGGGGGGGGFGGNGFDGTNPGGAGGNGGLTGGLGGVGGIFGGGAAGNGDVGSGGGGTASGAGLAGGRGGFGGGGGGWGNTSFGLGGYGGGGGGSNSTNGGNFGGGGSGYRYGGSGAGLGGAIFIRQGALTLNNTAFTNNTATGGTGASPGQGKGGAIFAMQSLTNANGNNQGMPTALPIVTSFGLGATFTSNTAANQAGTPAATTSANGVGNNQDNNDVYGTILGNPVNLSVSSNAGTEAGTTAITVTATAE
ncbi:MULTISPECIES: DUF4347 domain-containing protein, partial [unclassified Microcoleus]